MSISPGITSQTVFQRSTIIFSNPGQSALGDLKTPSAGNSPEKLSSIQRVIKPIPCPKLSENVQSTILPSEAPHSALSIVQQATSESDKTQKLALPTSPTALPRQATFSSSKQAGLTDLQEENDLRGESPKWISKLESNSFDDVRSFITKNGHSIVQALSEIDKMSGSHQNFFSLKKIAPTGFYKQDSTKEWTHYRSQVGSVD